MDGSSVQRTSALHVLQIRSHLMLFIAPVELMFIPYFSEIQFSSAVGFIVKTMYMKCK